jgi:uroporphyrinogen-III synthase
VIGGSQPLTGLRVLVGRAPHQASALSSGLRALGAEVFEIPFIEIRKPRSYKALDSALNHIRDYDWLILTSVNGADAVWQRLKTLRIDKKALQHLKVAAIGPATRTAIEKQEIKVAIMPRHYVAESVIESLRDRVKGNRVLLARARVARDVIPRELRKLGAEVDVVEAYETVIPHSSRVSIRELLKDQGQRPNLITFTSSSTVRNFVELLGDEPCGRGRPHHTGPFSGIQFASIGPVTSATLREFGLPVDIEAKEYTIPGLVKAIEAAHPRKRG